MFQESCIFLPLTEYLSWMEIGVFESVTQRAVWCFTNRMFFRLWGLSVQFIFLRLVCEAHLRKTDEHELVSFSTVYALEEKKKIPPKLIWFSSPEKEKPTNLLAKAREIRCSSVRPAPCVSHSDLCRCAQEHLLSALGYVECTDRWARVRLSKQCAGGCLSEALTTFHSLFIAFISFGL